MDSGTLFNSIKSLTFIKSKKPKKVNEYPSPQLSELFLRTQHFALRLPTANCQLPTANYLHSALSTSVFNCQLPTANFFNFAQHLLNHLFCTTFVVIILKEKIMGMPVRIDDILYRQARAQAKAEHRTIAGQIEFWAMIGRAALDNPDLPIDFVRDLLIARAEEKSQATMFVPEGKRSQ